MTPRRHPRSRRSDEWVTSTRLDVASSETSRCSFLHVVPSAVHTRLAPSARNHRPSTAGSPSRTISSGVDGPSTCSGDVIGPSPPPPGVLLVSSVASPRARSGRFSPLTFTVCPRFRTERIAASIASMTSSAVAALRPLVRNVARTSWSSSVVVWFSPSAIVTSPSNAARLHCTIGSRMVSLATSRTSMRPAGDGRRGTTTTTAAVDQAQRVPAELSATRPTLPAPCRSLPLLALA
ncbi:MAG: hypothetical protein JWP01_4276 [Myxococcales bacterium]|nr:hypothetical protein [Myxococcales bacterium]